jgi:hypothetical protein
MQKSSEWTELCRPGSLEQDPHRLADLTKRVIELWDEEHLRGKEANPSGTEAGTNSSADTQKTG